MVRKPPDGHLKASELEERLRGIGIDVKKEKLSKNDLVWLSCDRGLVTDIERNASLVRKNVTIPCYLQTHVRDAVALEALEKYVKEYSMMQTRGSFIANLIVQFVTSSYDLQVDEFPTQAIDLPVILSDENHIKKCFLPERWIAKSNPIDPSITNCLERHGQVLQPFKSTTYNDLMCDTGWDNALNHLGSMYLANAWVQIMMTLKKSLKREIESFKYETGTLNTEVWKCISYKMSPSSMIHEEDFEKLTRWRAMMGIPSISETLDRSSFYEKLNPANWTIYCWINKKKNLTENRKASLLPVSTIGRKFAYLDWKITQSLLPKKYTRAKLEANAQDTGGDLQKVFDLTPEQFNKKRQDVRNKLKKKQYKQRKGRDLNKKWKELGRGVMANDCLVRSISTDGVGLRMCIERIPKRPILNYDVFEVNEDTLEIGNDGGRVSMMTTVDNQGRVNHLKRKAYYNHLKRDKQAKYTEQQMASTDWGTANDAISQSGGLKNASTQVWLQALSVYGQHFDVLKQYQLESKNQAFRKMKSLRRKKAFFDQRLKNIIRPDKTFQGNIVFGTGNEDFACTGKGERAVPTVELAKGLRRVIKMLQLARRLRIVLIPEFNTTKCCHCCGKVMQTLTTAHGSECLRYRLCINCNNETIDKRRNRDVNAAKNILKLLQCILRGLDRPEALRIPEWYWKEKTHTWVAPIC